MAKDQCTTTPVAAATIADIEDGVGVRVEKPLLVAADLLHTGIQLLHGHLEGHAPSETITIAGRTVEGLLGTFEEALEKIDPEKLPWRSQPQTTRQ